MADKINNNDSGFWNINNLQITADPLQKVEVPKTENVPVIECSEVNSKSLQKNADAAFMRAKLAAKFVQKSSAQTENSPDLQARADKLKDIFKKFNKTDYKTVAPHIEGLSRADSQKLQALYQQQTRSNLLSDLANHLFMEDTIRAFEEIAPERIHSQIMPQAVGSSNGEGIEMDPPTDSVMWNSEVKYTFKTKGIGGDQKISYLLQSESGQYLEEKGDRFTTVYPEPAAVGGEKSKYYRVAFQVRYGNEPPEFYTYRQLVKEPQDLAFGELLKLHGTAPDSDLYLSYMDGQIERTKSLLAELETKKAGLSADIRNSVGNSSDKMDQLRTVEKQLTHLKSILSEMETARANIGEAFAGSIGKPIPLQAVLVARENGQSIPLQLYAKDMGGGKWAIVDVTNPGKPRIWEGERGFSAASLNQAWNKFVNGTNDLPAGQIAAIAPKDLGFPKGKVWNNASSGQSTLKQWSNGLGIGSLILAGLGIGALFGPGTQGAAVPLLLTSGLFAGGSSALNIADRVDNGTFEWNNSETAFDMLGIVGGIASLGGIGSLTNVGKTLFVNGAKFTVQKVGNATRILQYAEQGTNVAGGILIGNQYVSAIDDVNRSSLSLEEKASATRKILAQAVAAGGLMIIGVGLSRKFTPPSGSELNQLLTKAKLKPELENLVKNDLSVQKVFVNHGKDELNQIYDDYLKGVKTGRLKVKSFGQYLGTRGYSTSLDKDTTTLSEKIGGQNLELMSPRRVNERILELTNPELYRAFNTNQMPPRVKQAVDDVLNINQNLSSSIAFKDAQSKLNKQLYTAIGGNLRNTDELNKVLRMFGDNPSARGSVGNAYYQKNIGQGERVKEFGFNPELWTGKTGATNRRADDLLIRGRRTLDVKTGYADGYPSSATEIDQLNDYNALVKESRNPANRKLRKYLADNGVQGGELKTHDYLFLSNGTTNAEAVARKSFAKIEERLQKEATNIRVFYLGEDGKIYQVARVGEKLISKPIGDKLPN